MNENLAHLKRRRTWLVEQAARQRRTLSAIYQQYDRPIEAAASASKYFKYLKSPFVLTALVRIATRTRWKRYAKLPAWAWRGWKLYQIGRMLQLARNSRP